MIRVVVESPLGASTRVGIDANKQYARRCVLDALARGEAPYAAHLFYDQPELLDDLLPTQRKLGLAAGLAWATTAEICAVYLDHGLSAGMREGIAQARQLGQRVEPRWIEGPKAINLEDLRQVGEIAGWSGARLPGRLEIWEAGAVPAAAAAAAEAAAPAPSRPPDPPPSVLTCRHAVTACVDCGQIWTRGKEQAR